jgi:hypothetical protein
MHERAIRTDRSGFAAECEATLCAAASPPDVRRGSAPPSRG